MAGQTPAIAREPHGRALLALDPEVSTALIARVTVVDVDMPFGSMVSFMVKWSIAAIPAFLIVGFVFFIIGMLVAIALGAMGGLRR